jgi:hypothetical protein
MKSARLKSISLFRLAVGAAIVGLAWAAAFTPVPAAAQGSAQQQAACTPDALRLCGEFVPDVAKISACMGRKRAQLSPACRATMVAPHAHRASRHHHRH